jgi:hypothetical protein
MCDTSLDAMKRMLRSSPSANQPVKKPVVNVCSTPEKQLNACKEANSKDDARHWPDRGAVTRASKRLAPRPSSLSPARLTMRERAMPP